MTLQRNISTETLFEGVPEKGERTVVNVGGKRTLLVVDEVYTGIDDVNVRGYIREVLKVTKAQSEYQKYITEKVDNAKIMIK